MKITDECKMHLQTAVLEKGEFLPPPEHSVNSVSRRIVQVRQELLE